MEPSIEAALSRSRTPTNMHPFTLYLSDLPVVGALIRAHVRLAREENNNKNTRWVSLPPMVVNARLT